MLGIVLSWFQFIQWLGQPDTNLAHALSVAFESHPFITGLSWDLTISGVATSFVALLDHRRIGWTWAAGVILCTWLRGLCLGLPLYLIRVARVRRTYGQLDQPTPKTY